MQVVEERREVGEWVARCHAGGETVALVPTMGYLHEGHASLLSIARAQADRIALSIFVNPLQFGPSEDFERYPRDLDRDLEIAREAGVDLVFAPPVREMYPEGEPWVKVVPVHGADRLCGRSRPGHFEGVLTVVAKLFGIVQPDTAVFGRKDFQQLVLIRRMVSDLDLPVRIVEGPTVRDPDGLALSSRNRYLSPEERAVALSIPAALRDCDALFRDGERSADRLRERMRAIGSRGVDVEYAEVVDPVTMEDVETLYEGAVCAIAGRVGATRLIDNLALGADPAPGSAPDTEAVAGSRESELGR